MTVCERCHQGWQEGGGATIAIGPEAVARAGCDAQHVGSVDAAEPARAHQDLPPAVARLVWRRDKGRCRVPGCRSARGLEIHHIVHRADGGTHEALNCILLCSACHTHHHAGRLAITGTADLLEVWRIAEPTPPARAEGAASDARVGGAPGAHVGAASRLDAAITCAQAKDALVAMGWKPALASPAVYAASAALGAGASLEQIIIEALRRCPRPILDG